MTKEEKAVVINNLAEQLNEYPHFYLTDIETLNAEQTAQLRRKCFENEIKLVVVKNTLFGKALEKAEKADADLMKVLEGSTSVMFATTAKAPCRCHQGVPQEERETRLEGSVRGGVRLCRRQPVGCPVQH